MKAGDPSKRCFGTRRCESARHLSHMRIDLYLRRHDHARSARACHVEGVPLHAYLGAGSGGGRAMEGTMRVTLKKSICRCVRAADLRRRVRADPCSDQGAACVWSPVNATGAPVNAACACEKSAHRGVGTRRMIPNCPREDGQTSRCVTVYPNSRVVV